MRGSGGAGAARCCHSDRCRCHCLLLGLEQAPAHALHAAFALRSVGIIGFMLGGGQGNISPWVGLGADQLLALEMVLANGTVVEANESERGGVGGAAGAATAVR